MDNRGIALKNIHSRLAEMSTQVQQQNASGKFDINKDAENIAISLFNAVFNYQLKNANNIISVNFPAIDLVDDTNSVVIQVTSTTDSDKVQQTIEKFIAKNLHKKYKNLFIYIITKKPNRNKKTIEAIEKLTNGLFIFDVKKNIIDNGDIGRIIDNLPSTKDILNIDQILQVEFGYNKSSFNAAPKFINNNSRFKFNYRNQSTDFLDRKEEMNKLTEFYSANEKFLWWIIIGKAGSGKSRLALEFSQYIESLGGRSGFVLSNQLDLINWGHNYSTPVLVVIDYAQSEIHNIIPILKLLSTRENFNYKFRVLLIEREASADWWKELSKDYFISNVLFKENPLVISGIQPQSLYAIVEKIVLETDSSIKLNKDEVLNNLKVIDPAQRPLFAMFVGVALANKKKITHWNSNNLLEYIVDNYLDNIKTAFNSYNEDVLTQHINLAAVATVCYGLLDREIKEVFSKGLGWLPTPNTFDLELYKYIVDGSTVEKYNIWSDSYDSSDMNKVVLSPLLPDILGEYFVLKNLSTESRFIFRNINKLNEFIELTDNVNSYYFSVFFRRLLQDFPDHEMVINFAIGNTKSGFDMKGSASYYIILAMRHLYTHDIPNLKTLLNLLKVLSTDYNLGNKKANLDDPERAYQEGCQIMVYNLNGLVKEQLEYYAIIKSNTDKFEQNPKISIDPMVGYEDFSFEESMKVMEKMDDADFASAYIASKTVTDARIPHLEVLSIDCILRKENIGEDKELATILLDRLFYLCEKFTDPRMKKECLRTYLEYGPDKIKDFDEKVNLLLTNILNTPPQVNLINVEFEQFLFIEKLIWFNLSTSKTYGALNYYNLFLNYLLQKKRGNPSIGNAIINMSLLAERICKHFYERGITFSGDLFFKKLAELHPFLSQFPTVEGREGDSIDKIMMRVSNYRNGYF